MIRSFLRGAALVRRSKDLSPTTTGFPCCHKSLSMSPLRSSEDESRQKPPKENDDASSYIKDNPELENILRDLYDDRDRDRLVGAMQTKFDVFKDDDSTVIYDVDEERQRKMERQILGAPDEEEEQARGKSTDRYSKYNLAHGQSGVFDVDDLVEILRGEKCQDVVVMSLDKSLNYVDHMVVTSCKSTRHLRASASLVRKVYKLRRQKLLSTDQLADPVPPIEGFQDPSCEWLAIDLGNIALHFFLPETRARYDLESLWSHGGLTDPDKAVDPVDSQQMDDLIQESHSLLADLEPAESGGSRSRDY